MKHSRLVMSVFMFLFLFAGVTAAHADGWPLLGAYIPDDVNGMSVVVVGNIDSNQISLADADAVSQQVGQLIGLLGSSVPGTILFYTPGELTAIGLDGQYTKDTIKAYYLDWGFSLYLFLDIYHTPELLPGYGPTLRVDAWIADLAQPLGLPGDYLYVASVELPVMYTDLLGALSK